MTDAFPSGPMTEPRSRSSRRRGSTRLGTSLRVIIVSFIAFAVMTAIVVSAMLNTQQQQVKNLFQNVQYCVNHPKDPACDLSVAPSQ